MSDTPEDKPEPLAYESPDIERPASATSTENELESQAIPGAGKHDPYAALRLAGFRLFSLGWVPAILGDQMQSVGIGWIMFERTHQAITLGWVGLVQALPVISLALLAGQIADRFDRRRVVQIMRVVNAVCSLALAVLAGLYRPHTIELIYLTLFLGAVARAIAGPSRAALLPQIVTNQLMANAVAWYSSFFQVAATLGPALAGFILLRSVRWVFLLDAAGSLAFAAALQGVPLLGAKQVRETPSLKTLLAGIRFVRDTKIILATITLDLFAVLLGGATYLLPVYATAILHIGPMRFGWLRAAPAMGAVTMAIFIAHRKPMQRAGRAMLWAVAGFGVATIIFGISRSFWLSFAMLLLTGAFDNVSVVVRHTLVQVLTPDHMRGRVSAVNNVFIGASNEIGGFESGLTAQWFGPVASVVGGGIGTLLVVLGVTAIWPQIRKFGALHKQA